MSKVKKYLDTVTCLENLDIYKYESLIIGEFKERIIALLNQDILWANQEKKSIPQTSDGTEKAYFDGVILAVNMAKKIIKEYKP